MKVLAIDTSSMVATCAIMDEDKLIAEYILNFKRDHSQRLAPMIEEILSSCQLSPEDIDVYAAAKGPGSFTGLRIGLTTIKTLAQVTDRPVIGISTLDALAFNLPFSEGVVVPIMDARRDRVYTGIYKWDSGNFYIIQEQQTLEVEKLLDILKERHEKVIFNGDGTGVYRDKIIEALGDRAIFAPNSANMARASSVAELALSKAQNKEFESYLDLVPDYMRKSQAQREYDERIKGCGGEDE